MLLTVSAVVEIIGAKSAKMITLHKMDNVSHAKLITAMFVMLIIHVKLVVMGTMSIQTQSTKTNALPVLIHAKLATMMEIASYVQNLTHSFNYFPIVNASFATIPGALVVQMMELIVALSVTLLIL